MSIALINVLRSWLSVPRTFKKSTPGHRMKKTGVVLEVEEVLELVEDIRSKDHQWQTIWS